MASAQETFDRLQAGSEGSPTGAAARPSRIIREGGGDGPGSVAETRCPEVTTVIEVGVDVPNATVMVSSTPIDSALPSAPVA